MKSKLIERIMQEGCLLDPYNKNKMLYFPRIDALDYDCLRKCTYMLHFNPPTSELNRGWQPGCVGLAVHHDLEQVQTCPVDFAKRIEGTSADNNTIYDEAYDDEDEELSVVDYLNMLLPNGYMALEAYKKHWFAKVQYKYVYKEYNNGLGEME
jgi:hypothetical protein